MEERSSDTRLLGDIVSHGVNGSNPLLFLLPDGRSSSCSPNVAMHYLLWPVCFLPMSGYIQS